MSGSGDECPPAGTAVIELCIPSSSCYVSVARHAMDGIARNTRLSKTDIEDVRLALGEACNNAVKHSAHGNCNLPVNIKFVISEKALEIEIRNCHPKGLPKPIIDEPPSLEREGGYGFFLMKKLVDHVDFVWGSDYALVRLIKKYQPQNATVASD